MSSCKLCGLTRKFIKAHAIPEAFFREVRSGSASPILVSAEVGQFPKKAPIGVYDEGILCDVCEPKFDKIDGYAIKVLLKDFGNLFQAVYDSERLAGFHSMTVDPKLVLQFLVAVLWRASVSTHTFYSGVNLGPHQELAALALNTVDVSEVFDAVLSRWKDPDAILPSNVILDPRRERWLGINAYRLYLGEIVAYIKVDARPFPERLRAVSLRSAPPTFVAARSMATSHDLQVMKQTAMRSHQNSVNFEKRNRQSTG